MSGLVFWILTAALAAGLGGLVLVSAARAARGAGGADPSLAVHRRQLAELDDLVARGVMGEPERKAAYAEAGRRLLAAEASPPPASADGASARTTAAVVVGVAGLAAVAMYLLLGSPGMPDQPYLRRLEAWRTTDPAKLGAPQLAALMRVIAKDRPTDPQAFSFLGRMELESGDPFAAAIAFRRAAQLNPNDAEVQTLLGQALVAGADEKVGREAMAAFAKALTLDPTNVPARFYLAQAQVQAGRGAEGAAALNALAASLPAADPRRARIEEEAAVAAGNSIVAQAAANAPAGGAAQAAFIQSMVQRLAARLKTQPDDPEGWVRLVRAYGVLGDRAAQQAALVQARKQFAGRPADLAKVEAEAPKP